MTTFTPCPLCQEIVGESPYADRPYATMTYEFNGERRQNTAKPHYCAMPQVQTWLALYEDGQSLEAIAQRVGTTPAVVNEFLTKEMGVGIS